MTKNGNRKIWVARSRNLSLSRKSKSAPLRNWNNFTMSTEFSTKISEFVELTKIEFWQLRSGRKMCPPKDKISTDLNTRSDAQKLDYLNKALFCVQNSDAIQIPAWDYVLIDHTTKIPLQMSKFHTYQSGIQTTFDWIPDHSAIRNTFTIVFPVWSSIWIVTI